MLRVRLGAAGRTSWHVAIFVRALAFALWRFAQQRRVNRLDKTSTALIFLVRVAVDRSCSV